MMGGRISLVLVNLALFGLFGSCLSSLTEEFGPGWEQRWHHATDEKYTGVFVVEDIPDLEDPALKVPEAATHYGLTSLLEEPAELAEGVTIQFEVKWANKHTCGGGYLKFFTHDSSFKAADMKSDTPYSIMFGPDKCGSTNKVHLILRHKSPIDGEFEEKHLESPPSVPSDTMSHVYTASIKPDNTVQMLIDDKVVKEGNLLEIFSPPINPPEEIPDPSDVKPETWVDDAKIPDPDATKPDDWVEEEMIVDESAEKPEGWLDDEPQEVDDAGAKIPEDWDTEEDGEWLPPIIPNPKCEEAPGCGEWEPPIIPNPDYKGEWSAPLIDNPEYKGPWVQSKIANPKYFHDEEPLKNIGDIGSVGIEIWTMDDDMYFDNIVVTGDPAVAKEYRGKWKERNALETVVEEDKKKKKTEESESAIGDFLEILVENPFLDSVRPYLEPVVEFAKTNELIFVGILAATSCSLIFLFFLTICKCCCGRKSEDVDIRSAKKEDKTGPDDAVPAEKSKEESKEDEDDDDDEDSEDDSTNKSKGPKSRRTKQVVD